MNLQETMIFGNIPQQEKFLELVEMLISIFHIKNIKSARKTLVLFLI